jgi:CheY-like chemotaxis protein
MAGVLLVEDSPYESALAYVALSRTTQQVLHAPNLRTATRMAAGARLAILGTRAIARISQRQVRALGIPAVGIGARFSVAEQKRALAAGVRAVYARPRTWRDYLALLEKVQNAVQA